MKLSSVISDIHGVSGRAMLRSIIAGERSTKVLAEMARGVMRRKIARLEEALDCSFFTPEHAFILEMMLDSIDQLTAQVAVLDERIAVLCEPYERQIAQLDGIPGFGVTAAQDLIAEIGVDMSAFATAGHLCSWARVAPRARESGKRKGKSATGRGNPFIGGTLGETAASAGRTQTFLGAKLRRLCRHMPKKKARRPASMLSRRRRARCRPRSAGRPRGRRRSAGRSLARDAVPAGWGWPGRRTVARSAARCRRSP